MTPAGYWGGEKNSEPVRLGIHRAGFYPIPGWFFQPGNRTGLLFRKGMASQSVFILSGASTAPPVNTLGLE